MNELPSIDSIIKAKEKKERGLYLRSVLFALAIVFGSLAWLIFSDIQIEKQKGQVKMLVLEKDSLSDYIKKLRSSLDSVSLFSKQTVEVDYRELKMLGQFNHLSCIVDEFLEIKEHNPKFNYYADYSQGFIKKEEFNSPSLMISVLKSCNLFTDSVIRTKQDLEKILNARAAGPTQDELLNGDIVFYKSGYVMLYISGAYSEGHKSFCIGMTPFGVLTLKPSFAEIERTGRFDMYR